MTRSGRRAALLIAVILLVAAALRDAHSQDAFGGTAAVALPAVAPPPAGAQGALIRYGRLLLTDTPRYAGRYVTAGMSCSACHLDAGRKPHGGSLRGTYARFPQWNKRAGRFITLEDRIDECFLYSMNGRPPPPFGREVVALSAYIAWVSRGAAIGSGFPGQDFVHLTLARQPSAPTGHALYAQRCAACHGVDGAGNLTIAAPPLWGSTSFNDGAGMNRKMAAFVRANMPADKPGSLDDQQAADVSAYVLSHRRPHFDRDRLIAFPTERADFF